MTSRPYHALRHRDFRHLWLAQLVSQTGSQMQVVAINWHIYLLTHSALALGFVGLTRVVPVIVFSMWGGVLADRADRRRVMFVAQSVMAVVSVVLAALAFARRDSVAAIYVLNAVQAAAAAFDNPARQALVPRLVPPTDLPGALALNLSMFHAAMIVGPALGGDADRGGQRAGRRARRPAGDHGARPDLRRERPLVPVRAGRRSPPCTPRAGSGGSDAPREAPLAALRSGLRFVFTTPLMVWTMALDFFATFFSGAMSLLPIVADQVLGVGAVGLRLAGRRPPRPGPSSARCTPRVRPLPRRQGRVLLWAVGGLRRGRPWPTACRAATCSRSWRSRRTGLADVVSTVIRQTLRQLLTPDALRGRMTSVNMIFFMGGPQLGEMEAGLVASLFASADRGRHGVDRLGRARDAASPPPWSRAATPGTTSVRAAVAYSAAGMKLERLEVELDGPVARVWLNRPEVRNAFDGLMVTRAAARRSSTCGPSTRCA